ncbi:MAG: hypothetical protein IJ661_04925 [Lachnospiraceae bacterium]|nr:hypothetical protein [Lachnospiraceae bacterium]
MGGFIAKMRTRTLAFAGVCAVILIVMTSGITVGAEGEENKELPFPNAIEVTETTFPDAQIRKAIREYVYMDDDCKVYINPEDVEYLFFEDEVVDITGLSVFSNLHYLTLMHYTGTEISLQNDGLQELSIGGDKEELIIDAPFITVLNVYGNGKVRSVDLTKTGNVEDLDIFYDDSINEVKGLSSLVKLKSLCLADYPGETIEVSGLETLQELVIQNGKLASLDVSRFTELNYLDLYELGITSLDVSGNSKLERLFCDGCTNLSDVKLPGSIDRLSLDRCNLKAVDVSGCRNLSYLYVDNNKLTSLDVSKCKKLDSLSVKNNMIRKLDVSKCKPLCYLYVDNNKLTSIDVRKCKKLIELSLAGNKKLSKIDISKQKRLSELNISNTRIKKLDTSKNKELSTVDFHNTLVSKADFSKNKNLFSICYYGSKLKKCDFSQIKTKNGYVYILYEAKRGAKIKLKNFIGKGYKVYSKSNYLKYNKKKKEITISKKIPRSVYTYDDYNDYYDEDEMYQYLVLKKGNMQIKFWIDIK